MFIGPRSLGPTGPTGTAGPLPAVLGRSGLASRDYCESYRAGLVLRRYSSYHSSAAAAGPSKGPGLRYSYQILSGLRGPKTVGLIVWALGPQNGLGLGGHTIGLWASTAATA